MLQFQCPHCRAVIRVHHSAMGRRGTCQKCGQKLLVPSVNVRTESEPEDTEVIVLEEESEESGGTTEDQAVNELLSALSSPSEKPSEIDPILNVVKRGNRSNNSFLVTGIFFLLIGVVGAITFYYLSQPLMQGELTAQVVPMDSIKPMLISRHAIEQPELFESFWLKSPGKKIEINSRLLETSVLAQKRGLELRLYPGPDNDLYRVDVLKNKPLHEYYKKHSAELEKKRKSRLVDATTAFLEQMVTKEELLRKNSHLLIEVRDRMILTAMVQGLGFRLAAELKGKQYPCVWQDKKNRLYFALPKGTTHFTVREAELAGQAKIFPESMRFDVSCPEVKQALLKKNKAEPPPSPEPKKKETKQDEKAEMEESGESKDKEQETEEKQMQEKEI